MSGTPRSRKSDCYVVAFAPGALLVLMTYDWKLGSLRKIILDAVEEGPGVDKGPHRPS